jgi:hypothetical protein
MKSWQSILHWQSRIDHVLTPLEMAKRLNPGHPISWQLPIVFPDSYSTTSIPIAATSEKYVPQAALNDHISSCSCASDHIIYV